MEPATMANSSTTAGCSPTISLAHRGSRATPEASRSGSHTPAAARSDHIAVTMTAPRRPALPSGRRPVQLWVLRHPPFAKFARQRLDSMGLHALAPMERWRRCKQALKAAAAATRDALLAAQPTSPQACAQRAMQLVRGLHRDGPKQVSDMRRRWATIQPLIERQRNGYRILDHDGLSRAIRDAIVGGPHQHDDAGTLGQRPQGAPRSDFRKDRADAWHMQRRWLAGVTTEATTEAPAMSTAEALAAHWSSTFVPAATDRWLTGGLARIFIHPHHQDEWPTPTAAGSGRHLGRAKSSAPGPDGLPYRAWAAAVPDAWAALT